MTERRLDTHLAAAYRLKMFMTSVLLGMLLGGGGGRFAVAGPAVPPSDRAATEQPAPTKPVQKPPAKSAKQCRCFDWVHLADFGHSCYPTATQCEQARTKGFPPGRGHTTPCQPASCP